MKGKRVYAQLAVKRESPVMFRGCQFETIGEKQLDKTASMFGNSYSSWEKLIYTLYSIQISFSLRRKNGIISEREFEQSSLKIKEIIHICRGSISGQSSSTFATNRALPRKNVS